jgi:tryptophanyl-tRNA synthetase
MGREVFVEPKPLLTSSPRVPGLDGRKMSKSFDNAIYLADDEETVRKKMMQAVTDPARKRRDDPGNPDVCNIFAYHKLFTESEKIKEIASCCRNAEIGCVDCKKMCIENALGFWRPVREKRAAWDGREDELLEILREGSIRARKTARAVMEDVRKAICIDYK